ncbi:MAG TPA: bifunctional riboflavin kinase/FAD synthetase [Peptococcaceae bacterium]|nr:bifunctional riboflavin kinase/FAD synthetase [Peptococcaceae bacterium]
MELCTVRPGQTYEPTVIALGNFDGVHLGHQKLLKFGLDQAKKLNVGLSVLLFNPHPLKIIHPERKLHLLTGTKERLRIFEELGINKVYFLTFTPELANTSPRDFVREVLLKLGVLHVVVGFNYSFGYKGQGTPNDLEVFGKEYGFGVTIVQAQKLEDKVISSTEIRKYLINGEIDLAKKMMGRSPTLSGIVVHGDGRGRKLGFPTANLKVEDDLLIPKNGVYAVSSVIDGKKYGGMMNIGVRPTFLADSEKTIEIYFFGWQDNLYGRELTVSLEARLRPERKFGSQEEIIAQLKKDQEQALQILKNTQIFLPS